MIPDRPAGWGCGHSAETRYIRSVREMVRQHRRLFLFATLAGLALRLLFLFRFPSLTADSLVYGDIAKNWLEHGVYGITDSGKIVATSIRLPGYPAFLAAVFSVFGMEHYRAALLLQVALDLASCFLIADLARRAVSPRTAKVAFVLAALCPFLADYAAAALTETLEIFFTVLALDCACAGLAGGDQPSLGPWLGSGAAVGAAILLRPDGGLLLLAIAICLLRLLFRASPEDPLAGRSRAQLRPGLRAGVAVALLSLAPLVPWTLRNLHTLNQFQPLAPRYASEKSEFVPMGFNHWVKTWMADYVSVEEIYWSVPGGSIGAENLPRRAFDSPDEHEQTLRLLADYNSLLQVTPALDARFQALAEERIHAAPLRYYLWLPLVRIADMWLRPRTELLPCDTRWWEFDDDPKWSGLALGLGALGVLYVVTAFAGLAHTKLTAPVAVLLTFVVLRSVFLGSLENPEPRYTLECYPVVLVLAAALFCEKERDRGDSEMAQARARGPREEP
jgi:4-amino-4-deoxy-L-arabinose transferase-like glycosyltransferase